VNEAATLPVARRIEAVGGPAVSKGGPVSFPELTPAPDKLVSGLLRDDPEMYDLVEEFISGLPARLSELRRAYEQLNWDALTKLAHQLKGAGGSFGYPDLSGLAATMEQHFRAHSTGSFKQWMEQLDKLATAARAGLRDD
jgi:HPt (histidine-containing phosphotransfer) domain-containing protein